jgi:hypothetical protein
MKYMISWMLPMGHEYHTARDRFLKTGGLPPAGVTMVGRWHGMNRRGFAIAESTDGKALYAWMAQWADVLEIDVTPCLEDAEAGAVLQTLNA